MSNAPHDRKQQIVTVLEDAFADLMSSNPAAFRTKFRKMAMDPHSFYRGTACLFYADLVPDEDPFAAGRSRRIWVHGDLHVENFGTYLDSDGRLVFDVNDFDEAYLGRFTWDVQRFAASLALLGWQKALPQRAVVELLHRYLDAYLDQVDAYADTAHDEDFALHLGNTDGPIRAALVEARKQRRSDLLDANTDIHEDRRRFREDPTVRRLEESERAEVLAAFEEYLGTIPEDKRFGREVFYDVLDVVGKSGFGIGSAGLPAYNILIEGYSQAFENDVLLSMKQGNVPAMSRYIDAAAIEEYFENEGQRTVVSQRALQVHTDPLLGYATMRGQGFVVAEVSPFEVDLDWSDLTEPDDMAAVVGLLGRATAKIHCAADEDSDQDLVDFQVEDAIRESVDGRREEFRDWVVDFGLRYADQVRTDHALFVEAFREGEIGISAT